MKASIAKAMQFYNTQEQIHGISGLTKRELFAALALQGILASGDGKHHSMQEMADTAARLSDVLIQALNRSAK